MGIHRRLWNWCRRPKKPVLTKITRQTALPYISARVPGFFRKMAVCVGIVILIAAPTLYYHLYLEPPFPLFESVSIVAVNVNATTRMIVCELYNRGTVAADLYLDVENWTIKPFLPTIKPGESLKYAFRYDGPWNGTLLIPFRSITGKDYEVLVELPSGRMVKPSGNPEGGDAA